jgi:hypothetical protein
MVARIFSRILGLAFIGQFLKPRRLKPRRKVGLVMQR